MTITSKQRRLDLCSYGRRSGNTTALLDIAIANARRGEQVVFWTLSVQEAQYCYREASRLIFASRDEEPEMSYARLAIHWPQTARGCLFFGCDAMRLTMRGFRATVVVNDLAVMPGPEPMHAHTVINGE